MNARRHLLGYGTGIMLLAPLSCGTQEQQAEPVAAAEAGVVVLSELPFAELDLPLSSRESPPPDEIPITTPWRYIGESRQHMHKWATELPIRPRGLFFNKPEEGIELTFKGKPVKYDRFGQSDDPMWVHDRRELVVYLPEKGDGPAAGDFVLSYPLATDRERLLNLEYAVPEAERDEKKAAFAWSNASDGWDTRRGLLLPAPGVAAWDLTVPKGGEFRFVGGLEQPEVKDREASDGAKVVVELEVDGQVEVLDTEELTTAFVEHRVDLSGWAGKNVRLRVRTEPGDSSRFDYAFLAEPTVASRIDNPVRVVMVFIDTLRPDHLSMYGYNRDTSAALDHLRESAVVFTNARSVAPWTLPSARSIITGRDPEHYEIADTLPGVMHRSGWSTAMFAGNVYLSQNFGMTRDWDFHRVGLWPQASDTTNQAIAWMDAHAGQNQLLQVHYMSTHVPYVEPAEYRYKYAGQPVEKLRDGFMVSDVRKANVGNDTESQQYVMDRYDNNVRYATDQVQRIVERLDDNDILIIYSDHGEEFWDHQGFEHGHTLYDELLRVPLIIKAPGFAANASLDAPVSLLDIAPTVYELTGTPAPAELRGRSLVPLLQGLAGADGAFKTRNLAFGRPLYGLERWGVLQDHTKWTTTEGREALFDLASDRAEKKNLLKNDDGTGGMPYRKLLGDALDRQVPGSYRLVPTNHRGKGERVPGLWALCTIPGGFSAAWPGEDPDKNSEATVVRIDDVGEVRKALDAYGFVDHPVADGDGAVEVCWHAGWTGSREVYLGPANVADLTTAGRALRCSAWLGDGKGGTRGSLTIPESRDAALGADRSPLSKANLNERTLSLEFGIAPVPDEKTQALNATNGETQEMLVAMGYALPDAPEGERPTDHCEPPPPTP